MTEPLALPEVLVFKPVIRRDARGQFREIWQDAAYAAAGVPGPFVQDNVSVSGRGVLRGLHFQFPRSQGKLISVLAGGIFDVCVDVRHDSRTFGRWTGTELSDENGCQLYVPPGFAHGFAVLSSVALVAYKCTEYYAPDCEQRLRWDDHTIGIRWPVADPRLSDADAAAPVLADIPISKLPSVQRGSD
jgi:dTDP-4-dehydrorhamnose 3,5-epimerase